MATPDSIGTASCFNCAREVFVRKNSGGFAYYRCEQCGAAVQHHIKRHSEQWVSSRVKLENQAAPETVPSVKKPEKAEPVATPPPAPAKPQLSAAEKFLRGEK